MGIIITISAREYKCAVKKREKTRGPPQICAVNKFYKKPPRHSGGTATLYAGEYLREQLFPARALFGR